MNPSPLEGSYESGGRLLEYWTRCEDCPERKECKHTCSTPGFMRFSFEGVRKVYWSGIITRRKIERTKRVYLDGDPPADVGVPPRQGRLL